MQLDYKMAYWIQITIRIVKNSLKMKLSLLLTVENSQPRPPMDRQPIIELAVLIVQKYTFYEFSMKLLWFRKSKVLDIQATMMLNRNTIIASWKVKLKKSATCYATRLELVNMGPIMDLIMGVINVEVLLLESLVSLQHAVTRAVVARRCSVRFFS